MQPQQHEMFGFVPAQTQCENCGKIVMLVHAVITTHTITETYSEVEHFCGEECAMESWQVWRGIPE